MFFFFCLPLFLLQVRQSLEALSTLLLSKSNPIPKKEDKGHNEQKTDRNSQQNKDKLFEALPSGNQSSISCNETKLSSSILFNRFPCNNIQISTIRTDKLVTREIEQINNIKQQQFQYKQYISVYILPKSCCHTSV